MENFRLTHLSDLHLAVQHSRANAFVSHKYLEVLLDFNHRYLPSTFAPRKAILLAAELARLSAESSAILITGDIATTDADLAFAKEWIFGAGSFSYVPQYQFQPLGADTIPRIACVSPTVLMPGNHDRFQGGRNLPGSVEFEKVFGNNWDLGNGNSKGLPVRKYVKCTKLTLGQTALTVVCADLSLKSDADQDCPLGYLGQGRAYADRLSDLVDVTEQCQDRTGGMCVVWAIHFPPRFYDSRVGPRMRLISEDLVLQAADKAGIRIIFCGHTHLSRVYKAEHSKVYVVNAGTPCAFGKDEIHSFHDVSLEVDGERLVSATVTNYEWHNDLASFTIQSSQPIQF